MSLAKIRRKDNGKVRDWPERSHSISLWVCLSLKEGVHAASLLPNDACSVNVGSLDRLSCVGDILNVLSEHARIGFGSHMLWDLPHSQRLPGCWMACDVWM